MEKTYGISVRSVLDMEVLKGAKLFAGRGGLDRIVTSMNVMVETPDIVKWVSPGDLLVTTAYSCAERAWCCGAWHQAEGVYSRNAARGYRSGQRALIPDL